MWNKWKTYKELKIKIEVISAVKEAEDYCKAVQNGQDKVQAWEEIVISPYYGLRIRYMQSEKW